MAQNESRTFKGDYVMANGNAQLADLRARVAFAIMCFRFGRDPQNPPNALDPVPVNLSTDLTRSVERQILTAAANALLQANPGLPFTWRPTPHLDLFKQGMTYKEYHALCWLQLQPVMPLRQQVRQALHGMDEAVVSGREAADSFEGDITAEEALGALAPAAGVKGDEFPRELFSGLPSLGER